MSDLAIEIRGLVKIFPQFTLGPLDLSVPRGAIYGLIGPNGAGKTTTLDLILGMGREKAGAIRVFGLDHRRDEVAIKLRLGYVSPALSFNKWKTVGLLSDFIRRFYPDWDDTECARLMDAFGLGWDDKIASLSLGMQTKLGLTMALAHRPALLLLDEPTTGLDAVAKRQLFAELLAAVRDENRTVLIATNSLPDIERFADHLGMIKGGRMLLEGSTADILDRYRMVDFSLKDGAPPPWIPGIVWREVAADRVRALVDLQSGALDRLSRMDQVADLTETPLDLEDLFVALLKGDRDGTIALQ